MKSHSKDVYFPITPTLHMKIADETIEGYHHSKKRVWKTMQRTVSKSIHIHFHNENFNYIF